MSFDIVIPVGPDDYNIVKEQLKYTIKNIKHRNIYVVVKKDIDIDFQGIIKIDEENFPFSFEDISNYHGKSSRNGWYLQQLIKLYAGFVIPGITERYLVIDCDTHFLKEIDFIDNEDCCLFNWGEEYHMPYFEHMQKLHPTLTKMIYDKSGISHHMMFEKVYVRELFDLVEKEHRKEFWKVFLENVSKDKSGASEYEIYFNFMLRYHPDKIKLRKLNFQNSGYLILDKNFDYVSVHYYFR